MRYIEPPQFVICIFNEQNPVSLEQRKLYRVVEPEANDPSAYIRIVDESGEDYLYPRDWFVPVDLPKETADALEAA